MMKKLTLLAVLIVAYNASAQRVEGDKYIFAVKPDKISLQEVGDSYVPSHPLGEQIARSLIVLQNEYTFRPEPSATNPNPSKEVEKPSIYFSAKKLHSYFKKQAKKGNLAVEEARDKLYEVINICVNIRYENTVRFEQVLRETKDPEQLVAIFEKVELL